MSNIYYSNIRQANIHTFEMLEGAFKSDRKRRIAEKLHARLMKATVEELEDYKGDPEVYMQVIKTKWFYEEVRENVKGSMGIVLWLLSPFIKAIMEKLFSILIEWLLENYLSVSGDSEDTKQAQLMLWGMQAETEDLG